MAPSNETPPQTITNTPLIIIVIRFGCFSILAQRETTGLAFEATREELGKSAIDLPHVFIIFNDEQKATDAHCS